MKKPEDFGTDIGGRIEQCYCNSCIKNGAFIEPDISVQEMISRVTESMVRDADMTPEQAGAFARVVIPTLKRWQ